MKLKEFPSIIWGVDFMLIDYDSGTILAKEKIVPNERHDPHGFKDYDVQCVSCAIDTKCDSSIAVAVTVNPYLMIYITKPKSNETKGA